MNEPLRAVGAEPPVPPDACPLCGAANGCAMARGDSPATPCWCVAVVFDAALLARVPPAARGRACICAACATARSDTASRSGATS